MLLSLPMSRLKRLAPIALVLAFQWPILARGQAEVSAQASVQSGVNSDPSPGDDTAKVDGYTEVSPSLALSIRSARAVHLARYAFVGTFYYSESGANAYSNLLEWAGSFQTSPNVRLALAAGLTQGRQNATTLQQAGAVQAQPRGDVTFIGERASQGLEISLGPLWSLNQDLTVDGYQPIDAEQPQAPTLQGELGGGLTRSFSRLSFGLRTSLIYAANLPYTDALLQTDPIDAEHLVSFGGALTGSWTIARDWSTEAQIGVREASRNGGGVIVQPEGSATVRFSQARINASFSYAHRLRPNPQLGETFVNDELRLSGRIPLGRPYRERWFFSATAGYDHSQQVDLDTQTLRGAVHIGSLDVSLEWLISSMVQLTFGYRLGAQGDMLDPDRASLPECQNPNSANFAATCLISRGFSQHVAYAGLTVRYPGSANVPASSQRRQLQALSNASADQASWDRLFDPTPGQQPRRPGETTTYRP